MDQFLKLFNLPKKMTDSSLSSVGLSYEAERAKYVQHLSRASNGVHDKYATELENTPIFSLNAKYLWNARNNQGPIDEYKKVSFPSDATTGPFAQAALLGFNISDDAEIDEGEPIMLNTSAPNSTFICGSQGSGKSYTLSCILENCLLPDADYGSVANPVAGVAFNYDTDSEGSFAEVASLCSRSIKVKILVSASNYWCLKKKYEALPGADEHLIVDTLAFKEEDLDIAKLYKLMAFAESGNGTPLYEQVISQVLREMGMAKEKFTMKTFEARPEIIGLEAQQKKMLDQRIILLKSYLANYIGHDDLKPKTNTFRTTPGELTIVDLTDPFINPATACTLFDISLSMFKQKRPRDGMIVVLDEAHRYMNDSPAALKFTESLLTTIRMQRHSATRVVIATQEPTISERLLDLCSTSIVHRFNSPAWFKSIKEHLAGASSLLASHEERNDLFQAIVELDVGESFVFSPSSFFCASEGKERKLGAGFLKIKTRIRKGEDSGRTKLAGDPNNALIDNHVSEEDKPGEIVPEEAAPDENIPGDNVNEQARPDDDVLKRIAAATVNTKGYGRAKSGGMKTLAPQIDSPSNAGKKDNNQRGRKQKYLAKSKRSM